MARSVWTRLPASPLSPRHDPTSAFIGTSMVIVGGSSTRPCPSAASGAMPAESPLRAGATFDSRSGIWRTIADTPTPVSGFNIAIVGARMYVLTANVGRADSPVTFLSYDAGTNRWTTLPSPPDLDSRLVAAGTTVVAVARSDERRHAVDAAFDAASSRWRILPEDPLGPSSVRDAVWVGDHLLLTAAARIPNLGSAKPTFDKMAMLDQTFKHWSAPMPDSQVLVGGPLVASGWVVWPDIGSSDGGGDWARPYPQGGFSIPPTVPGSRFHRVSRTRSGSSCVPSSLPAAPASMGIS